MRRRLPVVRPSEKTFCRWCTHSTGRRHNYRPPSCSLGEHNNGECRLYRASWPTRLLRVVGLRRPYAL